jgi:crotonobetainyl-CoA:carnitine CoA-transferase CaiB-like acyl-CoA transferase
MAARTAVVAGTATAVAGGVSRHQAGKQQQAAEAQAYEADMAAQQQQAQIDAQVQAALAAQTAQQQAAAAAAPAPAAAPAVDVTAELQKLAGLKEQGLIDDAEFAALKAKVLGL